MDLGDNLEDNRTSEDKEVESVTLINTECMFRRGGRCMMCMM